VKKVYIEAWRGWGKYPLMWFTTPHPDDRPWRRRTFETIVGKTAVVHVTSDDNLTRAECLAIATMEMTDKCKRINLNPQ
jgi:hypothetical protein